MPRKYTRYGINRQYRRNPSRKRNPFPYRLPFVPDYRTNPYDSPDAGVSAATASRYRQVVEDIVIGAQKRMNQKRREPGYQWPYRSSSQDARLTKRAPRGVDWMELARSEMHSPGKWMLSGLGKYAALAGPTQKELDRRALNAVTAGARVWPVKGPEAAVWAAMRQFVTS